MLTEYEIASIGQELAAANNVSDIDFARAVIAKYENKLLLEQEPVGYLNGRDSFCHVDSPWVKANPEECKPLYLHPALSAPKQEPFAWHSPTEGLSYENHYSDNQPLFEHPAPSAPEGWQLVPIEPTTHMVNEGLCGCMDNDVTVCIWKKMLAAARNE